MVRIWELGTVDVTRALLSLRGVCCYHSLKKWAGICPRAINGAWIMNRKCSSKLGGRKRQTPAAVHGEPFNSKGLRAWGYLYPQMWACWARSNQTIIIIIFFFLIIIIIIIILIIICCLWEYQSYLVFDIKYCCWPPQHPNLLLSCKEYSKKE